jgi:hypothetical protein
LFTKETDTALYLNTHIAFQNFVTTFRHPYQMILAMP